MIRYTSNRKYANAIKDLNRKYNEKFFNINNKNVAGYDVTNRVWFFDENIVDYNDYLRYARFTPEQLKYLRHFSTNLTNLFQEIDSKIDFQNFNTIYKFEGDVYSVYKSDTTTVIYLTDSVKGTEKAELSEKKSRTSSSLSSSFTKDKDISLFSSTSSLIRFQKIAKTGVSRGYKWPSSIREDVSMI